MLHSEFKDDILTLSTESSRLVVDTSDPDMWVVRRGSEVAAEDVAHFASALSEQAPEEASLLLWNVTPDSPLAAMATAGGWKPWATKALVGRDLTEPLSSPGWSTTSLAELGLEAFASVMCRAAEGDPFDTSTPESAADDLMELIDGMGEAHDPRRWVVVSDDDGVIGVVLPQTYPDGPEKGTLIYVGVVPERRGQGFGAAVHRFGLDRLQAFGVRRYVGSTDTRNHHMLRIFERNGAAVESTQHFYGR